MIVHSVKFLHHRAGAGADAAGRGGASDDEPRASWSRGWPRRRVAEASNKLILGGAVVVAGEGAMVGELRGMAGRGAADRRRRRLGQGGAARRRGVCRPRVAAAGG